MNAAELRSAGDGRFEVTGPVVFATAGELLKSSRHLFGDYANLYLDLGGVSRVDSAALALLIEWLRQARHQGRRIRIENIPEKLMAIARLTGVEEIIATPGD